MNRRTDGHRTRVLEVRMGVRNVYKELSIFFIPNSGREVGAALEGTDSLLGRHRSKSGMYFTGFSVLHRKLNLASEELSNPWASSACPPPKS